MPEEDDNSLDNLLDAAKTKKCIYPDCENKILEDSQFDYCEICRGLAARNAIALVIDPTAPQDLMRGPDVLTKLVHNLTGDEILRALRRSEEVYTFFLKIQKIHNIVPSSKKVVKTMEEQIYEARAIANERPVQNKRRATIEKAHDRQLNFQQKRIKKMKELMGGKISDEKAKELLGEDMEDDL